MECEVVLGEWCCASEIKQNLNKIKAAPCKKIEHKKRKCSDEKNDKPPPPIHLLRYCSVPTQLWAFTNSILKEDR